MMKYRVGLCFGIISMAVALTACGGPKSGADTEADGKRLEGIAFYDQGDYAQAIDSFSEAVKDCGSVHNDVYFDALYYSGVSEYELQEYEKAIETLTSLINEKPSVNLAAAYIVRGKCYIKLQNENQAALDFEEALKYEKDNYNIYCEMYQAFMAADFVDRAESYLKRLVSDENASDLLIGRTYYNLERYSECISYLMKAYDEGEMEAAYYLVLAYEKQEEYTKLEAFYENYMTVHKDDPAMFNQVGAYLLRRGRYTEALNYIERALDFSDLSEVKQALLFNQAVCYEYLTDYAKARTLFTEYLKEYPEDTAAQKEKDFLESR